MPVPKNLKTTPWPKKIDKIPRIIKCTIHAYPIYSATPKSDIKAGIPKQRNDTVYSEEFFSNFLFHAQYSKLHRQLQIVKKQRDRHQAKTFPETTKAKIRFFPQKRFSSTLLQIQSHSPLQKCQKQPMKETRRR